MGNENGEEEESVALEGSKTKLPGGGGVEDEGADWVTGLPAKVKAPSGTAGGFVEGFGCCLESSSWGGLDSATVFSGFVGMAAAGVPKEMLAKGLVLFVGASTGLAGGSVEAAGVSLAVVETGAAKEKPAKGEGLGASEVCDVTGLGAAGVAAGATDLIVAAGVGMDLRLSAYCLERELSNRDRSAKGSFVIAWVSVLRAATLMPLCCMRVCFRGSKVEFGPCVAKEKPESAPGWKSELSSAVNLEQGDEPTAVD